MSGRSFEQTSAELIEERQALFEPSVEIVPLRHRELRIVELTQFTGAKNRTQLVDATDPRREQSFHRLFWRCLQIPISIHSRKSNMIPRHADRIEVPIDNRPC